MNLTAARKRLEAHPWIKEVPLLERALPSMIRITVREQQALAVMDVHKKVTLNTRGRIFKEWERSDPSPLPLIQGVTMAEIADAEMEVAADGAFHAVMDVLQLGAAPESIIPNHLIGTIRSDPDLGITLHLIPDNRFFQVKKIKLGFGHYSEKYERFRIWLRHLKKDARHQEADFLAVDLNNPNHIVILPATEE